MLLWCLLAFGLMGILCRPLAGARLPVILLLSIGSIAFMSPASLLLCLLVAGINFLLLRSSGRGLFVFSVCFNVAVLLAYQVYELVLKSSPAPWPVLLGVAFLSLQHIDHLFRVRLGQAQKPQGFCLYLAAVFYLPKFFSGPIASLPAVTQQIIQPQQTSVAVGLSRFLLGLFKKLVLAESLALCVHSVLDFNDAWPGLTYLCGTLLYSLQLYFDFAGYTDMAVGVSMTWGIVLPENFNFPFRQRSWAGFWKSWHSSLTGWLWQYIFNPLFLFLGRRNISKTIATLLCALAAFAGMALFNGLQSGFFISAAIFALFYFFSSISGNKKSVFNSLFIFLIFSLSLIFFRDPQPQKYSFIIQQIFNSNFFPANWQAGFFAPLASGGTQHDYFNLTVTLILVLLFFTFERKIYRLFTQEKTNYAAWFITILLLLLWGVFTNGERFIYMQF